MSRSPWMPGACPLIMFTGDGANVGRCFHHLKEDGDKRICHTHGDVAAAVKVFIETGKHTDEREFKKTRKQ